MTQLYPASLDWYQASYVYERLVMCCATLSVPTPGHINAAHGKHRLEYWPAEAPFTADAWWSQRVALERASDENGSRSWESRVTPCCRRYATCPHRQQHRGDRRYEKTPIK